LGVVITTSTGPAFVYAGVVAVIEVSSSTVTAVVEIPPKVTSVAPVKAVPVIITSVPPAVEPAAGEMLVKEGGVAAAAGTIRRINRKRPRTGNTEYPLFPVLTPGYLRAIIYHPPV
jgi:hypothetical protein